MTSSKTTITDHDLATVGALFGRLPNRIPDDLAQRLQIGGRTWLVIAMITMSRRLVLSPWLDTTTAGRFFEPD